jgi:predicted dehydrogenase
MSRRPTPLPILDRPLRVGVVGLGQIAELHLPTYQERPHDVEVVALCDTNAEKAARWQDRFPKASAHTDLESFLGEDMDVVDVLVPTPAHGSVATRVLDAGFHVQIQKPLARTLEDADAMLAAAARNDATLRILEDYLFYPPLVQLKALVDERAIGLPQGLHMKIVATARGGWDVPMESYRWQWEQAADGRGMLVFDHGWHQLAVAMWLLGPIRRIFGWISNSQVAPELAPDVLIDAPSTLVWEHDNGVRGVMDITLAQDMYFRSDYYTCDERIEVTGATGYARCNRISARGVQEPSVVLYTEGEMRSWHALPDDPPSAFRASTAHGLSHFRGEAAPLMDGAFSRDVLAALLTALESAKVGRVLDV